MMVCTYVRIYIFFILSCKYASDLSTIGLQIHLKPSLNFVYIPTYLIKSPFKVFLTALQQGRPVTLAVVYRVVELNAAGDRPDKVVISLSLPPAHFAWLYVF